MTCQEYVDDLDELYPEDSSAGSCRKGKASITLVLKNKTSKEADVPSDIGVKIIMQVPIAQTGVP